MMVRSTGESKTKRLTSFFVRSTKGSNTARPFAERFPVTSDKVLRERAAEAADGRGETGETTMDDRLP